MGVLDSDLVSRLVKATNDSKPEKNEGVLYGTVVDDGTRKYVHLDGSDGSINTPVLTTTDISDGDVVMVQLKNHTATVTGNMTDPAIGTKRAGSIESSITQTADKIRLEVKDEVSKLSSSITQTAGEIRLEVADGIAGLQSSITQTAGEIRLEISDEVSKLNSSITQTAGEIRSEVNNKVSGLQSSITQNANGITTLVSNQNAFSKFQQTVNGFSFMGAGGTTKISGGHLNLTGSITWSDFASDAQTKVNTAQSTANTANSNAATAQSTANTAYNNANTANNNANAALTTISGFTITSGSKTYIDGQMIYTDSIYADSLHLGGALTIYQGLTSNSVGGYIGYDSGFNITEGNTGIGMRHYSDNAQVVCTSAGARLSYSSRSSFVATVDYAFVDGYKQIEFEVQGNQRAILDNDCFRCSDNKNLDLGYSSKKWKDIYAINSTIITSDRNEKHSIEDLPEKYVSLIDLIKPKRFKLNSGTSDRYHIGYIAQEVEEAMLEVGIDGREFGGFVKNVDAEGNDIYMLRYGEFDAIYLAKIRQLDSRIASLEARLV